MNYGDEYIDVTDEREPVLPDYEEHLDSLPPITDEDINRMSKDFKNIFKELEANPPF